jgi:hypothetical protein
LTQDNRDKWARNRERFFLNNTKNQYFLEQIEKAMVFLVLDDAEDYGFENVSFLIYI